MTPALRALDEALTTVAEVPALLDLEQVAHDAAVAAIVATLATWSRADLAVIARALALGSPTQLAAGSAAPGVYDIGDKCSGSGRVRGYTPPTGGAEGDAGRLYRALGGPR